MENQGYNRIIWDLKVKKKQMFYYKFQIIIKDNELL